MNSALATHQHVVLETHSNRAEGTPEVRGQLLRDMPKAWRVLTPTPSYPPSLLKLLVLNQQRQLQPGAYKKCRCSGPRPSDSGSAF